MNLENIDFGFACISNLIKDCSTARTVPMSRFNKIEDEEAKIYALKRIAEKNLTNTIRLLWHCITEDIQLYRFSSQLIPLGNHPKAQIWDFADDLSEQFEKIGRIITNNQLKVSTHPGQFTVINTKGEEKFKNAVRDLVYHNKMLNKMGLNENAVMVTHVGGVYEDKGKSLKRFIKNFNKLPEQIQNRLVIENDDTSYSIGDVLSLCQEIERPMVLDVHHHQCYNQGENLADYLADIFSTWQDLDRPAKIHFSSPKSKSSPKSHADYIDPADFLSFLEIAKGYKFDVMIEAKEKDKAVLKLWKDICYSPKTNLFIKYPAKNLLLI